MALSFAKENIGPTRTTTSSFMYSGDCSIERKTNFIIRSEYFGANTLQSRHVAERTSSGGTKAGEAHMNATANGDSIS